MMRNSAETGVSDTRDHCLLDCSLHLACVIWMQSIIDSAFLKKAYACKYALTFEEYFIQLVITHSLMSEMIVIVRKYYRCFLLLPF